MAMPKLCETLSNSRIRYLDISGNKIGANGINCFIDLFCEGQLRMLYNF